MDGTKRFVLKVLWYYSRDEVEELDCINMQCWPRGCSWMLSNHIDVIMWDTANGPMDKEVRQKLAKGNVVDVWRPRQAKICEENDQSLGWMRQLLIDFRDQHVR